MAKLKLILTFFLFSGLIFSSLAEADSLVDSFNKRFEFVRQDNKLVEVKDRFLGKEFKIAPLVHYYKNLLQNEQLRLNQKGMDYKTFVQNTFEVNDQTTPEYLVESLSTLRNIDIEKVFSNPKFNEILGKFELKIGEELEKTGLITLARPQDSRFFYKREAIYEITKMFFNMAKSQIGEVPVLNTLVFILSEAERLVRERRTFHQNMLFHYLENFSSSELGIREGESAIILSSIYESKIIWYAFWESQAASEKWDSYGKNKFAITLKLANSRLAQQQGSYETLGKRHDFAFMDATLKGKKVIINLIDKKDMFSAKHSVAYYYENPKLVVNQRILLQLAQLGLSFVNIPQTIKDFSNSYFKSMYDAQRLTEGALVGYFESKGQRQMAYQMMKQNVNPFEF